MCLFDIFAKLTDFYLINKNFITFLLHFYFPAFLRC